MERSEGRRRVILAMRFSALGEVAMTLPLMYNIALSNPDREFIMLTGRHAATFFFNTPPNLEVRGIDGDITVAEALDVCRELRRELEIEGVADLQDSAVTRVMRMYFRFRGIRTAHLDAMQRRRKALTRSHDKNLTHLPPVHQLYADVFSHLGLSRTKTFTSLFGAEGAAAGEMSPITEGRKGDDETWIAIAPFASYPGKIYPGKRMLEVIDHFASQARTRVFLIGSAGDEADRLELWRGGRKNVINVASRKGGLRAELAVLSNCDVLLSMDSANMHLASLVGCPVVSVWGATHPMTGYYGRGQSPENAIQLALPCRPCSVYGEKACARRDYLCLTGIKPELIISRINRVCALDPHLSISK